MWIDIALYKSGRVDLLVRFGHRWTRVPRCTYDRHLNIWRCSLRDQHGRPLLRGHDQIGWWMPEPEMPVSLRPADKTG